MRTIKVSSKYYHLIQFNIDLLSEMPSSRNFLFPCHFYPSGEHTTKTFIILSHNQLPYYNAIYQLVYCDRPISQLENTPTPSLFSWHLHQNIWYLLAIASKTYNPSPSITSPVHKPRPLFYHPTLSPFRHFTCSTCTSQTIHIPGASSENPALQQYVRLVNFINTKLCLYSDVL